MIVMSAYAKTDTYDDVGVICGPSNISAKGWSTREYMITLNGHPCRTEHSVWKCSNRNPFTLYLENFCIGPTEFPPRYHQNHFHWECYWNSHVSLSKAVRKSTDNASSALRLLCMGHDAADAGVRIHYRAFPSVAVLSGMNNITKDHVKSSR